MSTISQGIRHRARPLVGALVGLLAGLVIVGLVALSVQTYALTSTIHENQKVNTSTNQAILSCTEPKGECSMRNSETTGQAVADIAEVSIIASACADRPGAQNAVTIERCVRAEVERRNVVEAAASE